MKYLSEALYIFTFLLTSYIFRYIALAIFRVLGGFMPFRRTESTQEAFVNKNIGLAKFALLLGAALLAAVFAVLAPARGAGDHGIDNRLRYRCFGRRGRGCHGDRDGCRARYGVSDAN